MLTDQGTGFIAQVFKEYCKLLGVKDLQSTKHRHETNAIVESQNYQLGNFLRSYIKEGYNNSSLQYCRFPLDTNAHSSLGDRTPFELMDTVYSYDGYLTEL